MSTPNTNHNRRPVRVTRTTERRSPESLRRLGRALIALARAQLEAEAQAEAEARFPRKRQTSSATEALPKDHPADEAGTVTGDAA